MAEKRRTSVLGAAGRTAFALLRHTGKRAKMGTLHLPIALQPARQPGIELQVPAGDTTMAGPESSDSTTTGAGTGAPPVVAVAGGDRISSTVTSSPERQASIAATRAMRGKLAVRERRIARLQQALERERHARALAGAAMQRPQLLIDQLAADIAALDRADRAALRETIAAVLGAHGFAVEPEEAASKQRAADTLPAVPGWDQRRLKTLTSQVLAARPEIGGPRYIQLCLDALARQGRVSASALAGAAGMTSPLARHRLRLALEGLCAAGVAHRGGDVFTLVIDDTNDHV